MSPRLFKRLSDENLGSRLASGEAAAFDELYRRYVHRLAAYASQLLGDAAAGEDVAQTTLLKAYGALRDGRVPLKMRPWLFRIAHNAAIDLAVRRRELPSDDLPELPGRESEPMAGALVTALASLPDRQRRVYVLREVHGMRIDETAAELGLAPAQVEQALFAARNRLAELLVFGDRLNCVAVRRLVDGPLDGHERRALKTHLRACPECRHAVGLRGRAPVWSTGPWLEWLRGLLVGGAAPVAAKVGTVVATATVAAGVPVVAQRSQPNQTPRARELPSRPAPASVHRHVLTRTAVVPVAAVVSRVEPHRVELHRREDDGSSHAGPGRDDAPVTAPVPASLRESERSGSDSGSSLATTVSSDEGSGRDGGRRDEGGSTGSD
ncbi:MAG: sigma-70 family RNA polymerase sigma factor [Gaiellaceae bacterium]